MAIAAAANAVTPTVAAPKARSSIQRRRGRHVRSRSTWSSVSHPSAAAISEVTSRLAGEASEADLDHVREANSSSGSAASRMLPSRRESQSRVWRSVRRRRRSTMGAAQTKSVIPSTATTAARLLRCQRARAIARSAADTSASTSGLPSAAGMTKVKEPDVLAGGADPPIAARRRTGTIEVETANASVRAGAEGSLPSACSATIVDFGGRGSPGLARSVTGSIRSSRGPRELCATKSAAGPSMRDRGRSETRPAHASGAASAS